MSQIISSSSNSSNNMTNMSNKRNYYNSNNIINILDTSNTNKKSKIFHLNEKSNICNSISSTKAFLCNQYMDYHVKEKLIKSINLNELKVLFHFFDPMMNLNIKRNQMEDIILCKLKSIEFYSNDGNISTNNTSSIQDITTRPVMNPSTANIYIKHGDVDNWRKTSIKMKEKRHIQENNDFLWQKCNTSINSQLNYGDINVTFSEVLEGIVKTLKYNSKRNHDQVNEHFGISLESFRSQLSQLNQPSNTMNEVVEIESLHSSTQLTQQQENTQIEMQQDISNRNNQNDNDVFKSLWCDENMFITNTNSGSNCQDIEVIEDDLCTLLWDEKSLNVISSSPILNYEYN